MMDNLLTQEDQESLQDPWNIKSSLKRKQYGEDTFNKIRKLNGNNGDQWDEELDLDDTCALVNLNVDLSSSTFSNSSDGFLSLPSLSAFKQELLHNSDGNRDGSVRGSPERAQQISNSFKPVEGDKYKKEEFQEFVPEKSYDILPISTSSAGEDCRFQYVLAAATSIATKVSEETLTYLNQGQPYEIKLKKLGDLSEYRGKVLKSVVRLCFHDRRLQVLEKEQMSAWKTTHPGDSILEVDCPLSYGIFDLSNERLNSIEFRWDPTREVGVYIKVNCISTEFTPKKHGGEKGVPFRIQVETYLDNKNQIRRLHAASCQVKVFKLKGADRKHKQDREKIQKRSFVEQEKYQCSYDCTILVSSDSNDGFSYPPPSPMRSPDSGRFTYGMVKGDCAQNEICSSTSPNEVSKDLSNGLSLTEDFKAIWSPLETSAWLELHRYGPHVSTLSSYSGADLLRLSKDNLIQLCGLPDGIRLFNALHSRCVLPKMTLYICVDPSDNLYKAIYLTSLTKADFLIQVCEAIHIDHSKVSSVHVQGPNKIKVDLTDQFIAHIPDQSAYYISADGTDSFQLLLQNSDFPSI